MPESMSTGLTISEYRFSRLLEIVPAAAYTCDAEGLITSYNARAVEAWGRAPRLNDPDDRFCGSFKLFSPDGLPITHANCWMALALQENRDYNGCEIVIERSDGTRRTVLAHANPFRDDEGTLTGAVNILVDITDRKLQEDALRDADRQKDEFLAILAHELRNPLAPIRNALRLLQEDGDSSPTVATARGMIERQVLQMVRLVDDLMDVSRITQNRLVLKRERVTMTAILQSAVEATRPFIEDCRHELTLSLPPEPIFLEADPTRMTQVFGNLLTNAAKFMKPGGRIWISARLEGSEVAVTVRDAGIGIGPDMLGRVFEPFVQADRSLESSHGGLGIGLSLVHRLVELHGGTIEARSAGLDQGSEFIVHLPVFVAEKREPRTNGNGKTVSGHQKSRILVVDDNQDSAISLAMVLTLMGHETRTAHDGVEAVEVATEMRPDVVLLDIGLPRMNGYDAARKIRENPGGDAMFLIALTGWGQDEDKRRSAESGFDLHMVKPVDPVALESLLAGLHRKPA